MEFLLQDLFISQSYMPKRYEVIMENKEIYVTAGIIVLFLGAAISYYKGYWPFKRSVPAKIEIVKR